MGMRTVEECRPIVTAQASPRSSHLSYDIILAFNTFPIFFFDGKKNVKRFRDIDIYLYLNGTETRFIG